MKSEHLLIKKLCYTTVILIFYILGRRIILCGIDPTKYIASAENAEKLLGMTVGGDIRKISIFALGISPYMIASIVMMIVITIRRAYTQSRTSVKKTEHMVWFGTFLLAIFQAIILVRQLEFDVPLFGLMYAAKIVAVVELVAGAMVIVLLGECNKKNGVGGQSVIILVNMLESIAVMLAGKDQNTLLIPVICALLAMMVTMIMENAEFRVPVQRISIYSIYADKNYIAIKLNPVGVLPAMFATAVFTFLQVVSLAVEYLVRDYVSLSWFVDRLTLSHPFGIGVFIGIIYLLTVILSLIIVSPSEISEQLLKSNDSICNIPSGRNTKRYLMKVVLALSFLSATLMSICIGVPLILRFYLDIDSGLIMLPSIAMMLTGVCVNFYREFETTRLFDSYRVFL